MAIICIPREEANKIKKGIKNGDINIAKMFDMTSEQRLNLFRKYSDEEMAKFLNKNFEKAMVSNKETAIIDWAKKFKGDIEMSTKDITDQIEGVGDLLSKVDSIEKIEDIIAQKIGIRITDEEFEKLNEYSNELKKLKSDKDGGQILDNYGNPTQEYFKKRNELEEYMQSLNPSKKVSVAVGVIGRGNMLFNVAPVALNIESNTLMGITGAVERRILSGRIGGLNSKEIIPFAKYITDMYIKTGYDLSSMQDLQSDFIVRGETITHTEGKGTTRALGRFYKKFIFQFAQGVPDIYSQAITFADTANMESSRMAKAEGLKGQEAKNRALEIMKDSFAVYPKTMEGESIREKAKAEALYRTWKNRSFYSDAGLGARKFITEYTGEVGLGEALIPFVKTPANVVGAGIDYSGGLGVRGVAQLVEAWKNRNYSGSKENLKKAGVYFGRLGLGMLFTIFLASRIRDDDYMPDYLSSSSDEKKFAKQYDIPFNSIKIGNKWVSFDYFGAFAAPLKSYIHARKYGKGGGDKLKKYLFAVGQQVITIPGFQDLMELFSNIKANVTSEKKQNEIFQTITKFGSDFVSSRFIPSILNVIAKGLDQYERETKGVFDTAQSKIPILRNGLKEKANIFGDKIKTQPFLSNLMFGARVKSVVEGNDVYDELERLLEQGELPTLSDIKQTSSKVELMRNSLGKEDFNRMLEDFYKLYNESSSKLIDDDFVHKTERESKRIIYSKLSDEEKKTSWNNMMDNVLIKIVNDYGYEKYKKKSSK